MTKRQFKRGFDSLVVKASAYDDILGCLCDLGVITTEDYVKHSIYKKYLYNRVRYGEGEKIDRQGRPHILSSFSLEVNLLGDYIARIISMEVEKK